MSDLAAELTLETVLEIWQSTTARLEQTHLTLQAEVRRLTEELEEKNRQLAKQARLADLGQMAGHVAHEVRNHLVPLTLYLSLLKRQWVAHSEDVVEPAAPRAGNSTALGPGALLDKVESNVTALRSMVQDLLNFTANRQPQLQPVLLAELVAELQVELAEQSAAQFIGWESDIPADLSLNCDREMVRSALRNLLLNAVDALSNGGCITLVARPESDHWRIEICDDGEGISPAALAQIFDPFFTTKQTGTGLGLSIVERVMEAHQGQVRVTRRQPRGTCVSLAFPIQPMRIDP